MAFGLTPKHVHEYQLENLDEKHFLVLALDAAKKLNWNIGFVNKTGFIAYTKFSMTSWSEEVSVKIENGIANIKSQCTGSQLMDWGKNRKNVEQLLETIEEVKSTMNQEEIDTKISEIEESSKGEEHNVLKSIPTTSKEGIAGFFAVFKPTEGYFMTPILINLNLLLFAVMVISGVPLMMPENEDLLNWGANFRPVTLEGEWWRLLSCCFLHIGIFHLLLNMYALMFIGVLLEPYLGKERFLAAYLTAGIGASTASLWWHDLTISAGASGAIFGMYGVFIALMTTNILDKELRKTLITSIGVFVGYNILNGLKADSGIDNAAHIGGLLFGLIIGYAFVPSIKRNNNRKLMFASIGGIFLAFVIYSFVVYNSLPNDIGIYNKEMESFASMEELALEIYNLPEETPKEKILSKIKDGGIFYWNENIRIIDGLQSLDLPEIIKIRNAKLREYCELRIKSYEFIYKSIDEDTNAYDMEIEDYNKRIENIISEISTME